MQRVFSVLGWGLVVAGLLGAIASYFVVSSQEFVLALLARIVENPFEYRTYLAVLTACTVLAIGCLVGALYIGVARLLETAAKKAS